MADIPPPPAGFTIDGASANVPPPPAGFAMDNASAVPAAAPQSPALDANSDNRLRLFVKSAKSPQDIINFGKTQLGTDIDPADAQKAFAYYGGKGVGPDAPIVHGQTDARPTNFLQGVGEGIAKVANNGAAALEAGADKIGIAKPLNALGSMLGMAPSEADAENTQNAYFAGQPTQASTAGNIVGNVLPLLAIPGGPIVQGALGGALSTDDRSLGGVAKSAGIGAIAGKAGDLALRGLIQHVGQPIVDKISSALGQEVPSALSKADANVLKQAADPDQIVADLREAQQLGIPATLADVSPQARSLAGAAVRRSPVAAGGAEAALIPRARGQVDRFMGAVQRDLGDITNIPEASEALTQKASAQAAPLYDKAYAAAPVQSDKIDSLLKTPFGQKALSSAREIAANEERDPIAMGFDGPAYSPQTLDYIKRGMDSVLEDKYRNQITGKLDLDTAGRAQNNVKNSLLQEVDRLNPDYKAARAVYAGPASEKAALLKGQTALDKTPDVLASMTKNLSDTQLEQFRLGYVGALTDRANKMRYTSNPFQSLLDNPAMAEKLQMLFPQGNVSRLLRQRDLERGLAATNNKILGNSETAARQIADADFSSGIGPEVANIGLNAAMGHPVGALQSAGRAGANAFASSRFGAAARARAEAIAPKLLNTDPGATADAIIAAIEKRQNYRGHVKTAKKVSNFFAPMASAVAVSAAGNRK